MRFEGLFGALLCIAAATPAVAPATTTTVAAPTVPFSAPALRFEENAGQLDPRARFVARSGNAAVFLAAGEAVFALDDGRISLPHTRAEIARRPADVDAPATATVVRMRFEGADPAAEIVGRTELPGTSNYLLGDDPGRWRSGVRSFDAVRYVGLYRGVDAVFYGRGAALEYDFVVAPGADPASIRLRFEGAERVGVDETGALLVQTARGALRHEAPLAYQPGPGAPRRVVARFAVDRDGSVGVDVGAYDAASPLVIDPVLGYSGYLGGNTRDSGQTIAVDGSALYVAGYTLSSDFPTADPIQPYKGGFDVFVAKMNASTFALEYATYVGGERTDTGLGIAVHGGSPILTGYTNSTDFPLQSPIQGIGRSFDAFVLKLTPSGTGLAFATYLGGSGDDFAFGVAVDPHGRSYVTGYTQSADFPTRNPFQSARSLPDGFVTKLEADGSAIVYSTYLGGEGADRCLGGIAVDGAGCAYVAGLTDSLDFPVANPIDDYFGLSNDLFVTKLDASGSSLVWSTYLGGEADESALGIALDAAGAVYVAGETRSVLFPPTGGSKLAGPRHGNESDVFAVKIASDGRSLVYARDVRTLIDEVAQAVAVDADGRLYVVGYCTSPEFPTHEPVQSPRNSGVDAFALVFDPTGGSYVYATKLGGVGSEAANAVALGPGGEAYVTGSTTSIDFPSAGGGPQSLRGIENAFVARITPGAGPVPPAVTKVKGTGKANSFKLTISGEGFQPGASVFVGEDATAWPGATAKGTKIKVKGGRDLEARFPSGVAVRLRVVNSDGGAAFAVYTR